MAQAPFFSVVIDNYNYGRYLGAAIDSVLAQDFPAKDVEVIVVDDGSTDESREVIRGYGGRIHPILQPNSGQAAAFNRGFSEARGKVVCLLDSDDVWRPGKLSAVAPRFDDPAVGCAEHFLEDTDARLKPLPQSFPSWPERYRLPDFLDGRTQWTATSGLAYDKARLKAVLPIPEELFYYLDDFLTVGVLFDADVANVPQVLGAHRVHGGNWCAGGLEDPRKLAVDARMRELFAGHLEGWLSRRAKSLSPGHVRRLRLEDLRRRVLMEALSARPAEAVRAWQEGLRELRGSSFGIFRLATVLLAALSPSLYLFSYSFYTRAAAIKTLRRRLFPQ